MGRQRTIAKRLGLAVAASLLGWLCVEALARSLLSSPWVHASRVGFITSPNWVRAEGALRYAPHATIRTAALYGDRFEYDVRFRTNDLGFIDSRDYGAGSPAPPARRWAFIGDSFTAGFHGGAPWVPALRDALEQRDRREGAAPREIYALGVSATGATDFELLLRWAARRLRFAHVAILFVTDDLLRPPWRPVERPDGGLVLCPLAASDTVCRQRRTRMLVLREPEASPERLRRIARQSGLIAPPRTPLEWLVRHSFVAASLAPRAPGVARPAPGTHADLSGWLRNLRAIAGNRELVLLQIPERDETREGAYRVDARTPIEAAGLRFVPLLERCGLTARDYLPIDGHLRASGYAALSSCVARELGLR